MSIISELLIFFLFAEELLYKLKEPAPVSALSNVNKSPAPTTQEKLKKEKKKQTHKKGKRKHEDSEEEEQQVKLTAKQVSRLAPKLPPPSFRPDTLVPASFLLFKTVCNFRLRKHHWMPCALNIVPCNF